MKRTKRIASVLLALVMALSLITTAFAAGETGSITIDNAVVGKTGGGIARQLEGVGDVVGKVGAGPGAASEPCRHAQ